MVIYDANNGSRHTRERLAKKFSEKGIHIIMLGTLPHDPMAGLTDQWLESICDNKDIIERNIRSVKISSPDVRMS